MIELQAVGRTYRRPGGEPVVALDDVSLRIERGDFLAVVGTSGSGKSTLMNVLGLLDRPDTGRYLLDGVDVAGLDADRQARVRNRRIGFVFQAFHLLPRTTALENVELPLVYSDRDDIAGLGRRALEQVGLADRMTHRSSELSGGQQQRVAIARALVAQPTVVFADEPTGNLDSKTGTEILELLRASTTELGQTMVMVTHDAQAASIADRVLFLADGAIVRELPRSPAAQILATMTEIS